MTKLLTYLNSINEYEKIKEFADGFIIGIKDLSNYYGDYSLEEVLSLIDKMHNDSKEIFISLNKNIHSKDLENLENTLKIIEDKNVTGILYYDISVVELKRRLGLKTPLVWSQEHLTTNFDTCNFWYSFGALYTNLSGELTLDEILEINKNSKSKVIVPIFGRIPMFISKRHLVKNYYKYFNEDYSRGNYTIYKEGNTYPIIDSIDNTIVYSGHFLNGLKESLILKEENIPYLFINHFDVSETNFLEILKMYKNVTKDTLKEYNKKIDELLEGNTDTGFLYKETVYKVK